jgi:hypothetical protein
MVSTDFFFTGGVTMFLKGVFIVTVVILLLVASSPFLERLKDVANIYNHLVKIDKTIERNMDEETRNVVPTVKELLWLLEEHKAHLSLLG